MKTTIYVKKEIRTADDLPSKDGAYFCWLKGDKADGTIHYRDFTFHDSDNWHNEDMWLKNVDWYLHPAELELPDDEEIKKIFPQNTPNNARDQEINIRNMFKSLGANWLRDKIKEQLKLNDEWDNLKDFNQPLDKPIEL